ncbi:uncharacterized protein sycp2 isoform X2 [Brachyhypopomus gauderio]|uniref:uncharacterized protein sycp2 isoform X2 n=2 Tax=Brachyhypopomus gauderio TaxID=698409 RepID=UPI0040424A97
MARHQEQQVEKLVDQALKHSKFQYLEEFLDETREGLFFKCSKQFLSKLDKLINRELDHRNVKHASVVFSILHKLENMLVFPGGEGISLLVSQGLVTKMVQWFEKIRQFWVEAGPMRNEVLINLAEDFFDALMVAHQSCKEGLYQVTESLLHHIGNLASDDRVNILIQKEAVKKLNVILGKIPMDLKKEKKILTSQEASSVMDNLAGQILKGGDYDLQVSLMEALCRMTSNAQRRELTDRWFSMEFVACAFRKIQDSEFETDCRKFLNLVNGMQGDGRSVFSYPCLEVFLENHPLLKPVDESLKEFWIDFNMGSQSISFYFCLAGIDAQEDGQWDTLCIAENEVRSYTVKEENGVKVLQLILIEPLCLSSFEGSRLFIHFSSSLDILQATKNVYGETKNNKFIPKTTTSVVKTTVQIILDDGGSQVLFPESQRSSQPKENAVPASVRSNTSRHSSLSHERNMQHLNQQAITPLKSKVSESCTYISGSAGRKLGRSPFSCVMPALTPAGKAKKKPALEMVATSEKKKETELRELLIVRSSHIMPSVSKDQETVKKQAIPAVQNVDKRNNMKAWKEVERYRRHIPVDKVLDMVQTNQEQELLDTSIVPDSQPAMRKETSVLPGLITKNNRISVSQHQSKSKLNAPTALTTELPQRPCSAQHASAGLSHKQLHNQLSHRLEQVLREREQQVESCPSAQRKVSSLEKHLPESASAGKGPGPGKGLQRNTPAAQSKQPRGSGTGMSKDTKTSRAADNMVKQISNHYKSTFSKATVEHGSPFNDAPTNRYLLNRNWYPTSTAKVAASTSGMLKSCNQSKKDVYEFSLDVPELVGRKSTKSSELSGMESSVLSSSLTLSRSAKKCPPAKPAGLNVKKHLFSDTDTGNMTEVSWLKSANRKPKPKLTDYTRQPAKPSFPAAETTDESPDVPLPSDKAEKLLHKPKRKRQKKVMEQEMKSLNIDSRKPMGRPQRNAALTKSYREPSDSEHVSETEEPPPAKKLFVKQSEKPKSTSSLQTRGQLKSKDKTLYNADTEQTTKDKNQKEPKKGHLTKKQRDETTLGSPEQSKKNSKKPLITESTEGLKECWATKIASFCPSPPSDRLRSTDKKTALPKSPEMSASHLTKTASLQATGQAEKKNKSFSNGVRKQPEREKKLSEESTTQLESGDKLAEKKEPEELMGSIQTENKKSTGPPQSSKEQEGPLAAEFSSICPSPFSTENMRSVENSVALPRSPFTPLQPLPVSPVAVVSPTMELPTHLKGIQASSFYKTSRGCHGARFLIQPPVTEVALNQSFVEEALLSPVPPEIQPLITSTGRETLVCSFPLNPSDMNENLGDSMNNRSLQASFDKESVISLVTLSRSSHTSRNNRAMICTDVEKTPVCIQGSKTRRTDFQSGNNIPGIHALVVNIDNCVTVLSGPATRRKRQSSCTSFSLSETDNSEKEEGGGTKIVPRKQAIKMKPRRLFKPIDQLNKKVKGSEHLMEYQNSSEDENKENVSPTSGATSKGYHKSQCRSSGVTVVEDLERHSRVLSNVVSGCWEASVEADVDVPQPTVSTSQEMGIFCHQFSSELKRKFESRSRRMDLFTKESLKAFRQHASSISVKMHKYRSQRLEKVKQVLVDEIKNLEEDDAALHNMEEELTIYWKKQALAFNAYQERGSRRLHHLKSAVETNMCDSLEYEEQIFSSEICLMKKDMRSVQDRLFKQMQEEELMSVRRGLQTLFLPDVSMF